MAADFIRNWFPPTPPRVAVEQLRMMLPSTPFLSVLACITTAVVASIYMVMSPNWLLVVWAIVSWAPVPITRSLARRFLSLPDPLPAVGAYMRATIILFVFVGVLRGVLPWIAFDQPSPLAAMILLCFMISMLAGSVAYMAPVLPAFVVYTLSYTLLMVPKMILLGEPVYWVFAVGAVFVCVGVITIARSSSITVRSVIDLRLENVELIEKLREETVAAEAARIEAEAANQAKSKFLAAASHDLRQPIHAQGLFLEVLARTDPTPEQRKVLANAVAACHASAEMLNTLLDFSRLEAGVVAANKRAFRLQPLLNKVAVELAPLADQKNIVYRMRETTAVVHSDSALLELILRNLISNAIRYTERGGVLVGCRKRGSKLAIEIWDTGIGIASENQHTIFREFHQLGNPERDRRKGLGLGLAITERLARTLGEDLSLESQAGRGSKFAITVSLAQDQPVAEPAQAPSSSIGPLNVQALVIDDDEAVRDGMQYLLQSWGARCETVETIAEALAKAAACKPDVVICDYRLRDQRTGLEAIAALRDLYPGLPAILITGDTAPERLREGQASGIPLLHKPVMPYELHRKIADALAEQAKAATVAHVEM